MKRTRIKIEYLVVAALFLTGGGVGGMLMRPAGLPTQTLPNRFGDVTYNHELHAKLKDVDCTTCHHRYGGEEAQKLKKGVIKPKPCHECHQLPDSAEHLVLADVRFKLPPPAPSEPGADPVPPGPMTAYHTKCAGCHKAMQKGPVWCYDCHAQSFSGRDSIVKWDHRLHSRMMNQECTLCHHQDKTAKTEADYHPCSACHVEAETLGVNWTVETPYHADQELESELHGNCFVCHVAENPDLNVTDCSACHADAAKRTADNIPSLEHAIHKRCMECHHQDSENYWRGAPYECIDCHQNSPSHMPGSKQGPVFWSHTRHSMGVEWDCQACHIHTAPGEPVHASCRDCHTDPDDFLLLTAPVDENGRPLPPMGLQETVCKQCIDCHKEKAPDNSFLSTECNACHAPKKDLDVLRWEGSLGVTYWNHREHAENMNFSCRECHHNTIIKDGKPLVCQDLPECPPEAVGFIACGTCHRDERKRADGLPLTPPLPPAAGGTAEPVAGSTLEAHGVGNDPIPASGGTVESPESGLLPDPLPPLRESGSMDLIRAKAPKLSDAVQGSCVECHKRLGAGPQKCEECHKK